MAAASRPIGDLDGPRPCRHLAAMRLVQPRSTTCPDCRDAETRLADLWICMTCGWVACSNESPGQHAKAHYAETDHPICAPLTGRRGVRWCHVHQRTA
jgi:uncharacterized UBP type Zn finger protein